MKGMILTPCWANAGIPQPVKPAPIEGRKSSLDFVPRKSAGEEENLAGLSNSSLDRYVPWQPVQSVGLESEMSQTDPASAEALPSLSCVPTGSGAVAAPQAELAIAPSNFPGDQSDLLASLPASKAKPGPAARADYEIVALSMPPGLALASPKGPDSSAGFPEAIDRAKESENRKCQPSIQQEGSERTELHAELRHGHHEALGPSKVLSQADGQLLEGCAVGPAHPCFLASDVNEAALMKPVSSLELSDDIALTEA